MNPDGGRAKEQIERAGRLLSGPRGRPEDNIRQDLGRLLDAMGIDNVITHRTPRGPADLYLPRMRTFVETKQSGLAEPDRRQPREGDETPLEQLERYLMAERELELGMPASGTPGERERPWTGILTDGRVWHAWRYAHERGAARREVFCGFRPEEPEALVARLEELLSGAPLGKPWIPARPRDLFVGHRSRLDGIHESLSGVRRKQAETKFGLWLDMLETSSMAPDNDHARQRLFVSHSFLVTIARGVIHTLENPGRPPDAEDVLRDGFASWIIESSRGRRWAKEILGEIHSYEWRRRRGDVLRSVYEQFIDATDRKIFGEHYTPDWLAELLVGEVLDDAWCEEAATRALAAEHDESALREKGFLDPACGSGTFLYHAARRLLDAPALSDRDLPDARKAAAVARLVRGIDVHPVAVEIARATLLRALPAPPPDGTAAIRIYQGDALMAQGGTSDSLLGYSADSIRFASPEGREILVPRGFANHGSFASNLRRLVQAAGEERKLPGDILASVPEEERGALLECRGQFEEIIREEGNSVWAWFVLNITAPLFLSERKVDRIVANPPWVTMAEIQVPRRKAALEDLARRLGLWTGGKQAPHHDIAQLFVKHCRETYLADPKKDPAAWLVKKTALRGEHWAKFREWHEDVGAQVLDLEKVRPFGGGDARRCCALVERRECGRLIEARGGRLAAFHPDPRDPATPEMSWAEARERILFSQAPERAPARPSEYIDAAGDPPFRQGATILPKVLVFVDRLGPSAGGDPAAVEVATARSSHEPWRGIAPQRGEVPAEWIRTVCTSGEMLPFVMAKDLAKAIIPTGADGALDPDPGTASQFWERLDRLWEEHRGGGRGTPEALIGRLDYASKLSRQLPPRERRGRPGVLYPRAGDIMRACRARSSVIVGDSLYRWNASSGDEAAYLVALLNAPSLNQAFVDSRESGRDFHLHFWRKVPVPRFDRRNEAHASLADLAKKAERVAKAWRSDPRNTRGRGQVAMSKRVREALDDAGILPRIDDLARRLLPDHAS